MGDEFSWNINNIGVVGVDLANDPTAIWGLKLDTGAGLRLDWFFTQGQWEISDGQGFQSPLGVDSFDTLAPFEYTLSVGLNYDDTFIVRLGRHHYERTEVEGLLNRNGFQASANAANVAAPLGWPGGELLVQIEKDAGALRNLMFNVAYYYGGDSSHMGILEGLVSLAFTEEENAPTLTLSGFGTVRAEAPGAEFDVVADGTIYGQGGVAVFDYDLFSATAGIVHRRGDYEEPLNPTAVEERFAGTVGVGFEPSNFVFRGAYTFLSKAFTSDLDLEPPIGLNESHFELSAGYRPLDWMLVSIGYRGIRGEEGDADQLFVGIQSALAGEIPFYLTSPKPAQAID